MKTLSYIITAIILIATFSFNQNSVFSAEPDWKVFSKNLSKALKSGNIGVKQSAMQMLIRYDDQVEVGDAIYDVMRVFRNEKEQSVRRLALTALATSDNVLVRGFLKRRIEFEDDPIIKKQLEDIKANAYKQTDKDYVSAEKDFSDLSQKVEKLAEQEKLYTFKTDDSGSNFHANKNKYVFHFNEDELPPVDKSWVLTLYDAKTHFEVETDGKISTIKSDDLTTNTDGSVTIYIQQDSPDAGKSANWLPAPDGEFYLSLRLYRPGKEAIAGNWRAPFVTAEKLAAK